MFKRNPSSDTTREAHTFANEIQISPDGKLFVTSDYVKVWNLAYFSVIYQLSSEDLVTGLAFSPDCKRFYDLRGSSMTAWEPNSLIRFSNHAKVASDMASDFQLSTINSHISEAWVTAVEPVTALSAAPGNLLYCASLENGTVELFDRTKGKLLEVAKFSSFLSIDHLIWSEDGKHIAAVYLGGFIMVKRLDLTKTGTTHVKTQSLLDCKANKAIGGIQQDSS